VRSEDGKVGWSTGSRNLLLRLVMFSAAEQLSRHWKMHGGKIDWSCSKNAAVDFYKVITLKVGLY
jgi:hypothetical protein